MECGRVWITSSQADSWCVGNFLNFLLLLLLFLKMSRFVQWRDSKHIKNFSVLRNDKNFWWFCIQDTNFVLTPTIQDSFSSKPVKFQSWCDAKMLFNVSRLSLQSRKTKRRLKGRYQLSNHLQLQGVTCPNSSSVPRK